MRRFVLLAAAASCLLLTGCASGGGGSTGSGGTSTPPPPPPPANQTLKQALTSSTNLVNDAASLHVALQLPAGTAQTGASGSPTLTVHYDAPSGTYTLTMASGSESFGPTDHAASDSASVSRYLKPNSDNLILVSASAYSGKGYTYGGMAAWQQNATTGSVQDTTFTTFAYGLESPAGAIPRTGAARFDIDVLGAITEPGEAPLYIGGPGNLDVDFASGVFSLGATTKETDLGSGASTTGAIYLTGSGHLSGSGPNFSGVSSWDGTLSLGGPMEGRFYGPNGEEVGGSFSGSDSRGGTMAGSFYGAQSTQPPPFNLTLTHLIANQRLGGPGALLQTGNGPVSYPYGGDVQVNTDGSFTFYPFLSNETPTPFTEADKVASTRPNFTTYQTTVSGGSSNVAQPTTIERYNVGPSNTELALTYTTFGIWRQNNDEPYNETDTVFYSYGILTPKTIVQHLTGQGHYAGVVYGEAVDGSTAQQFDLKGATTFDVNFSNQSFTSSFNLDGTGLKGAPNRNFGSFNAAGQITFDGTPAAVTQAGTKVGTLNLDFHGPLAEEIAAGFNIQIPGAEIVHPNILVGVMAAKKN